MKAAIYHRPAREIPSEFTSKQLSDLESFCKSRGYDEIVRYDEVPEKDGRQRPVFVQLMKDASRKKFDAVVVWSFKNFRRILGVKDVKYILHLKNLGIRFVSYQEPFFDTESSYSTMLSSILEWIVDEETQSVSERTKAGIEKAKRQGISIGRPKVQVDSQKAMEMHEKGMPLREIAQALGASKETVRRSLIKSKALVTK